MVERKAFIGKIKEGKKEQAMTFFKSIEKPQSILTMSIFSHENLVMIYLEDLGDNSLEALFGQPDFIESMGINEQCGFARMEDIFHYNRPKNDSHWQRGGESRPVATMTRIKRGKLSSYIYYHYILQENTEKVREKYGAIYMFDNYLFFYRELPVENEQPWYESAAQGDIPLNWQEVMNEHFEFWENMQAPWREIERWA